MTTDLLTFSEAPLTFDAPQGSTFEVNAETRTIKGLMLQYGVIGDNGLGKYSFTKGTLEFPTDLSRVKFLVDHDFSKAVGYLQSIEDTDQGPVGTFKIARGAEGDRALSMAQDKVWDGLSVGISRTAKFSLKDGVFHALHAPVVETSQTPLPAFAGARVTSVAASAARNTKEALMGDDSATTVETNEPVSLSVAEHEGLTADGIAAAMTKALETFSPATKAPAAGRPVGLQVNEESLYRFDGTLSGTGHDFSTDLFAGLKGQDAEAYGRVLGFMQGNLQVAGPRFVDTGDTSAVNPPKYRPDMFQDEPPAQPALLHDYFYKGALSDVTPFFYSRFVQASGLLGDHAEGVEPTPGSFSTEVGTTVTPAPVSGEIFITREVADQGGNPQVSGLIWNKFQRAFDLMMEQKTAALIHAVIGSVAPLASPAAGAPGVDVGASLEGGLIDLQFTADGGRYQRFFAAAGLYKALGQATYTATGEKVYPIIAPQNRDGSAIAKFGSIDVAGVRVEPTWSLGIAGQPNANDNASIYADPTAVHVWNSGLTRLSPLMEKVSGYTIGAWAYHAGLVYDVAGLKKVVYTTA